MGLGILIVYFSLIRGRNRDFDFWLPGPRVLTELKENFDAENKNTKCFLDCYQIFPSDLELLWEEASVNFSKSEPGGETKVYFVSMDFESKGVFEFQFELFPEKAIIKDIRTSTNTTNCDCD